MTIGKQQCVLNGLTNPPKFLQHLLTTSAVLLLGILAIGTAALGADGIGVYNKSKGKFSLKQSLMPGKADVSFRFGPKRSTRLVIYGDWDGDGDDSVGIYDRKSGIFTLRMGVRKKSKKKKFRFGPRNEEWYPIAGDWNGDGRDTVAIFDTKRLELRLRNKNSRGNPDQVHTFTRLGSWWYYDSATPLAGDWDGNGIDEIALYRYKSKEFRFFSEISEISPQWSVRIGGLLREWTSLWKPVVGDWDGNGVDTLALYDPIKKRFLLRYANSNGEIDVIRAFNGGKGSVVPVTGNWRSAPAPKRPGWGTWKGIWKGTTNSSPTVYKGQFSLFLEIDSNNPSGSPYNVVGSLRMSKLGLRRPVPVSGTYKPNSWWRVKGTPPGETPGLCEMTLEGTTSGRIINGSFLIGGNCKFNEKGIYTGPFDAKNIN